MKRKWIRTNIIQLIETLNRELAFIRDTGKRDRLVSLMTADIIAKYGQTKLTKQAA